MNKKTEGYLNENDLEVIVDVCLRELEQANTVRTRIQITKTLHLILCQDFYIKHPNFCYRVDMIKTKLE